MPFVVTGKCIKCRYTDCVEVCPVDCFYEGENMLVINPDECIDCGVCEPECPIEAIKSDEELVGPEMEWAKINQKFSGIWVRITETKGPMEGAAEQADRSVADKRAEFSEKSGG